MQRTTPYLRGVALATLLALGAVGCDGRGAYVRIDAPARVQLLVEERRTLDVDVTADGAAGPGLAWTSLDPTVATVVDDGTVTGVAPGATRITLASTALPDERREVDVDVLTAADHPAWVAARDGTPAMRFDVDVRTTADGPVAIVRNANAAPDVDGARSPVVPIGPMGPDGADVAPIGPTCPAAGGPGGRFLVRYAAPRGAAADVTARPTPWTHVRTITDTLHVVEVEPVRGRVRTAAAHLAASPGVVGVALDAVVTPAIQVVDPRAAAPWAVSAAGIGVAHDLLAVGPPAAPVTVAVIDGAVDLEHPDLAASLLPGLDVCSRVEDGRCAGTDDDPGVDDEPVPPLDHGTHVAGIVAATPPDDGGMRGVAPNARILPVKVFHADARCVTRISDLVTALRWSVGLPVEGLPENPHPADVVNLSLSGGITSDPLQAEIDEVRATGAVVVAAAGNDGGNVLPFPASADGVVAVGATTRYGVRASFSNARRSDAGGPGHLDLMAPGAGILSTVPGGYGLASGTSMAAPHVAGAAATLLGREPDLDPDAVLARLQAATYVDPTIMTEETYGAGVLRIDALHGAPAPRSPATRTAEVHVTRGGEAFSAPFELDRGVARIDVGGEGPVDLHLTWDGATYR